MTKIKFEDQMDEKTNTLQVSFFDEAETNSDLKAPEPTIEEVTYQRKKPSKIQAKRITSSTLKK